MTRLEILLQVVEGNANSVICCVFYYIKMRKRRRGRDRVREREGERKKEREAQVNERCQVKS